jgi:DNA-binding LacI/PurR family transcriptional regulator
MPSRLPHLPSAEPVDRRIPVVFVVLTLALLAPGIVHALTPADEQDIRDAARALESQGREAIAYIEHRPGTTDLAFSAELEDLAGTAQEIHDDLVREAVDPMAADARDRVAAAAGQLSDAADDASVGVGDPARLDRDRATLEQLVQVLHDLGAES